MALSPGTQALLDTALASHQSAIDAGTTELQLAAQALLAAQADTHAKAVALETAQQANMDLMAFVTQIQVDLAVPTPPVPPAP